MIEIVGKIVAGTAVLLLGICGVLSAVWKRHDLSWYEFMISGPLMLIWPDKYTREDRVKFMRVLTICATTTFIAAWVLLWFAHNR